MNLEQLKAEFPKVYEAAKQVGVNQEHDRVVSHVELGENTGDMRTALAAIRSGATMTPEIFTRYATSGRAHTEIAARLADDDVVQAVLLNAKRSASTHVDSFEKQVADRFQALIDTSVGDANIEDLESAG